MAVTVAEYKAWRGIAVSTYDAMISIFIASAQAAAERWCGRLFDNATRVAFYDGSGAATLQLPAFPIDSIDDISIWDWSTDSALQMLTSDVDYYFDPSDTTGIVYRTNAIAGRWGVGDVTAGGWRGGGAGWDRGWGVCPNWPRGSRNIRVDYTGGFGTFPDDLKMAFYLYIDYLWSMSYLNATLPPASTGTVVKEKIDRYEYELANYDEVTIKAAISRGLMATQAKLQELFGIFRRGDLL